MLIHAAIYRYIHHHCSRFHSPSWKLHFEGNRDFLPAEVTVASSGHQQGQGHLKGYLFFFILSRTERYSTAGLDICEGIPFLFFSYFHNLDQWKQLSWDLAGIKERRTANRMFLVGMQSCWNWFLFPDPEELKFYGLHSMSHSSYFSRIDENKEELWTWLVLERGLCFSLKIGWVALSCEGRVLTAWSPWLIFIFAFCTVVMLCRHWTAETLTQAAVLCAPYVRIQSSLVSRLLYLHAEVGNSYAHFNVANGCGNRADLTILQK